MSHEADVYQEALEEIARLKDELARLRARPSVEICREERARGNGGCGACALCCQELREAADDLSTLRAELAQERLVSDRLRTSWREDVGEEREKRKRVEAELARLRAAAQKWAVYAFNRHGDDSILYNGLADLGGVGPDGEGWISPKEPT